MTVDKEYLDAEGVKALKSYIDNQIEYLRAVVNLLNSDNETPGSIEF